MSEKESAIEKNVTSLLAFARVAFVAEYRGVKRKALGGDTEMDQWLCLFTHEGRPNEPEEFDFFTGMGFRSKIEDDPMGRIVAKNLKGSIPTSIAWAEARAKYCKPVKPSAASVLHSILFDMDACEQSFESWCGEYGYDTDSRKAYATYEACQQQGDKILKIIPRSVIEQLRDALQDY